MSESILSNEHKCLVCGMTYGLHKHHVYAGRGRRELSEQYGCWCYLCARHHNMSNYAIHADASLDLKIKRSCQENLERYYGWSRERFIATFGRNYIND